MLELLRISNYAIIDQLELEVGSGLTAVTGETGAGKSILLGALRLVLGERATVEAIRTGAERATIEAVFRVPGDDLRRWLDQAGFSDGDGDEQVLVRRELLSSGSSRNYVNNRGATLAQLKEMGEWLVDLHGQNDHTALLSPVNQLRVLDSFGDYAREMVTYREAYRAYRESAARLAALAADQGDAERRRSFLEFQIEEINRAALRPGEDEALETERRRLQNAERLRNTCSTICDLLYEGESTETPASSMVASAAKALGELAQLDPTQQHLSTEADAVRFALEDLCEKVRDYAATVQLDPERLVEVDDRLQTIKALKRKYGSTIEEILATEEALAAELNTIVNHDEEKSRAQEEYCRCRDAAVTAARVLSRRRHTAASQFEKKVQQQMRDLELPSAVLQVRLVDQLQEMPQSDALIANGSSDPALETLTAQGADTIDFLASLNAGEDLKPMRKVASGGEISRIMLAIKSVLAGKDEVPTLIFDEIDVGISGKAAAKVGEKLNALAQSHQVLCITHLPQIAARGDRHLVVEKQAKEGRTCAAVREVQGEERTAALARMLSGSDADDNSLRYAEKLLERRS